MNAVSLLREQFQGAQQWLEGTMRDVTPEQARWSPPGRANPLGASYAHLVLGQDFVINGMLQGGAPLVATTWAGKAGVSEPPPQGAGWDQWARRVQVDFPVLRQYAQAVFAATNEYLASLKEDDLNRSIDLSGWGLGQQTLSWVLSNVILGHVQNHCGEISCLKGLQGAQGFPV